MESENRHDGVASRGHTKLRINRSIGALIQTSGISGLVLVDALSGTLASLSCSRAHRRLCVRVEAQPGMRPFFLATVVGF